MKLMHTALDGWHLFWPKAWERKFTNYALYRVSHKPLYFSSLFLFLSHCCFLPKHVFHPLSLFPDLPINLSLPSVSPSQLCVGGTWWSPQAPCYLLIGHRATPRGRTVCGRSMATRRSALSWMCRCEWWYSQETGYKRVFVHTLISRLI